MAKQPTLSQRVAELAQEVAREFPLIEYRLKELKEDVEQFEERVRQLEARQNATDQRVAAVEQRSSALEKLSDRGWQLWLAALAFGFSLVTLIVTTALQLRK